MQWHIHAAGTSAPSNTAKRGHTGITDCGTFHIDPLFTERGTFICYRALFATNGRIDQPGLWAEVGRFQNLGAAKRACSRYYRQSPRNTYAWLES